MEILMTRHVYLQHRQLRNRPPPPGRVGFALLNGVAMLVVSVGAAALGLGLGQIIATS